MLKQLQITLKFKKIALKHLNKENNKNNKQNNKKKSQKNKSTEKKDKLINMHLYLQQQKMQDKLNQQLKKDFILLEIGLLQKNAKKIQLKNNARTVKNMGIQLELVLLNQFVKFVLKSIKLLSIIAISATPKVKIAHILP